MSESFTVDLFVEDRAHEELLRPLVQRIARESGKMAHVRVRTARGGHGRVLNELRTYQRAFGRGIGGATPDVLIIAIDANCSSFSAAQGDVKDALDPSFSAIALAATPDPHIERWYLADLEAFHRVVGITPAVHSDKCDRDYYKRILREAVVQAGHPPTLGGVEFARDLAETLDYFRAARDTSFKHFLEELRGRLKQ